MRFTDILSFCFSILGLYGLVYYLRFLIPHNLLPYVSAVLTEAEHLLDRAESIGVIPQPNDHRSALTSYEAVVPLSTDSHLTDQRTSCANEFLQIRMESHRAPGILRQLWLAVWYGLTCRLYALSSQVEVIKIKLELAMDERQLTSPTDTQSTTATALPTLTAVMINNAAEPHPASPSDAIS
ncbi:hypothetical protein F5888DRAFT_1632396 [Russula emetica]|nr:hypothetical protein F5888DRAFT_1632396 [Russula emetica]